MIYCFDLDGTLCTIVKNKQGHKEYNLAIPINDRIAVVNKLYDEGHLIKIDTARGAETGIDWTEFTKAQLKMWGLKHHLLRVSKKLHANFYIDDKALTANDFFKQFNEK
ncbi:hypothetical protein M0R04_13670 [Candidatus Dojkabacteria bacterium]|jgi:hypothetical protein|nr:hypothetical protein [Candidatus Dojkabacteria bacterium]